MATTTAAVSRRRRTSGARATSSAWKLFRQNLATAVAALANGHFLIVSAKGRNRFVQFARGPREGGTSELRVEAVSNEYLPRAERLSKQQVDALRELGWSAPTHRPKGPKVPTGSPNFYRDFKEPFPCDRIARTCVDTLTLVHGVRHPDELEYRAFREPGGVDVLLPTLGVDQAPPAPVKPRGEETLEEARAGVLAAVSEASKTEGLGYDQDGDIRVAYGSATLFVHVNDKPRFVRVFSPVVAKVAVVDEALLQRLNELNVGASFVRFLFANGTIWASADVFGHPLLPRHAIHACHAVGEVANDLRDTLKHEFGERTVFATPSPGALKN